MKYDVSKITAIAHGFGIEDKDITLIEDWTVEEMDKVFENIKIEFENLGMKRQRGFLYVYCSGHGCIELKRLYMILNGTASNIYPIEQILRDIAFSSDLATVFAIYDLGKTNRSNYPGLTFNTIKANDYP